MSSISRLSRLILEYESSGRISADVKRLLQNYNKNITSLCNLPTITTSSHQVPYPEHKRIVYTNNYIGMGDIKVVGFDLDYTLINYTDELQPLIYNLAKEILIKANGFPQSLKHCHFDKNFAIRGLSVDTKTGALLKLSHLQRIGSQFAYLGKTKLSKEEIEEMYGKSRHIAHDDLTSQMRPLFDLFSIAEGCLIADSIDQFERRRQMYGEAYTSSDVIDDVQSAIRDVHVSGLLHNTVMADLDRYIAPSPDLPRLFQHLKSGGKKVFLCTNSGYKYANTTLSHILNLPYSASGASWKEIFDVTMCSSSKPDFYFSKRPFRRWNCELESPSSSPVSTLEKGSVYVNGSMSWLLRSTGWTGKEILYIGDNLRADLVQARKNFGIHTACVIHELRSEVEVQNSSEFSQLHALRSSTRQLLTQLQNALQLERTRLAVSEDGDRLYQQDQHFIDQLLGELLVINSDMSFSFNKQFGSIFRTDGHPSIFAFAVKRYADIYMSDVSNLAYYRSSHHFYPDQPIRMVSNYFERHLKYYFISNIMIILCIWDFFVVYMLFHRRMTCKCCHSRHQAATAGNAQLPLILLKMNHQTLYITIAQSIHKILTIET